MHIYGAGVVGTDGRQLPESSGLFSLKYFGCISLQPKAPFPVPVCLSEGFIACPSVPIPGCRPSPGAASGPGEQQPLVCSCCGAGGKWNCPVCGGRALKSLQ